MSEVKIILIFLNPFMAKEDFIAVDFQLPCHSNELSKAEEVIEKLKKRFEIVQAQKSINDCTHTELFEEIVRCLLYIGKLSKPAFDIEDQLEALYIKQFKHSPALGKQLWLEHYDQIHHPYSILKNRCFRLLELLDDCYVNVHGKLPPNMPKKTGIF
jgi:hypothetical protein